MQVPFTSFKEYLDIAEKYINDTVEKVIDYMIGHFPMQEKYVSFTMFQKYPTIQGICLAYTASHITYENYLMQDYIRSYGPQILLERLEICNELVKVIDFTVWCDDTSFLQQIRVCRNPVCYEEYKGIQNFHVEYGTILDSDKKYPLLKESNYDGILTWVNKKKYQTLEEIIEKKIKLEKINLFDYKGEALEKYKGKSLKPYNLEEIHFQGKNISGLDLSQNIDQLHIHFDKLVHDLTNSNISGYDLKKFKFENWNLTNADLRNTGASVDLLNCMVNRSSKMQSGTLFDEENTFYFGKKKLSIEEVEKAGIKVYKKEKTN